MKGWNLRSREVAYLLNPAFCARILYSTIKIYNEKAKFAFPFSLTYLVLPLVLHKESRASINSRTKFLNWIQRYPQLLINFPKRTRELVQITNEAIELLLQTGYIRLTINGELEINPISRPLSQFSFIDDEIGECIIKGEHVARWFVEAGKVETIYIGLGVRP